MISSSVAAIAALSVGVGSAHGRTAKLLGMDKMGGGPGFMPRVLPFLGLANGAAWRASQLAANVVAGVQAFDQVRRRGLKSRLEWFNIHFLGGRHGLGARRLLAQGGDGKGWRDLRLSNVRADALRADASARRDIILQERANSLAEQLKCSEEAAHAAATAAYFASPDVIIAEFTGDNSSGQWPPKKLNDPKVVKQAYIDALELPEKKILALQFSTSAYFATMIRGYPTRSADKIRLKPTPHAQSRSLSLIPAFIMLTR